MYSSYERILSKIDPLVEPIPESVEPIELLVFMQSNLMTCIDKQASDYTLSQLEKPEVTLETVIGTVEEIERLSKLLDKLSIEEMLDAIFNSHKYSGFPYFKRFTVEILWAIDYIKALCEFIVGEGFLRLHLMLIDSQNPMSCLISEKAELQMSELFLKLTVTFLGFRKNLEKISLYEGSIYPFVLNYAVYGAAFGHNLLLVKDLIRRGADLDWAVEGAAEAGDFATREHIIALLGAYQEPLRSRFAEAIADRLGYNTFDKTLILFHALRPEEKNNYRTISAVWNEGCAHENNEFAYLMIQLKKAKNKLYGKYAHDFNSLLFSMINGDVKKSYSAIMEALKNKKSPLSTCLLSIPRPDSGLFQLVCAAKLPATMYEETCEILSNLNP